MLPVIRNEELDAETLHYNLQNLLYTTHMACNNFVFASHNILLIGPACSVEIATIIIKY